ncbi:MAG: hypothetical protein WAW69_16210, partial [Polaromonas sp.]
LYFEDLRGHGAGTLADDPAHFSRVQRSLAGALATDLRRLLAAQARRPLWAFRTRMPRSFCTFRCVLCITLFPAVEGR